MTVELLVRMADGVGDRKKGDIVAVKQVPHSGWGAKEGPPKYQVVKMPDAEYKDVAQIAGRHIEVKTELYTRGYRSKCVIDVGALGITDKSTKAQLSISAATVLAKTTDLTKFTDAVGK